MDKTRNDNDTVIINLDRPRELRLRHSVLKKFLATHKTDMAHMEETMQGYDATCELLLLMLQADDPTLTESKLDILLDAPDVKIIDVVSKVTEAITAAFDDGDQNENPPKAGPVSAGETA